MADLCFCCVGMEGTSCAGNAKWPELPNNYWGYSKRTCVLTVITFIFNIVLSIININLRYKEPHDNTDEAIDISFICVVVTEFILYCYCYYYYIHYDTIEVSERKQKIIIFLTYIMVVLSQSLIVYSLFIYMPCRWVMFVCYIIHTVFIFASVYGIPCIYEGLQKKLKDDNAVDNLIRSSGYADRFDQPCGGGDIER